jgi:hypothetical protein
MVVPLQVDLLLQKMVFQPTLHCWYLLMVESVKEQLVLVWQAVLSEVQTGFGQVVVDYVELGWVSLTSVVDLTEVFVVLVFLVQEIVE